MMHARVATVALSWILIRLASPILARPVPLEHHVELVLISSKELGIMNVRHVGRGIMNKIDIVYLTIARPAQMERLAHRV